MQLTYDFIKSGGDLSIKQANIILLIFLLVMISLIIGIIVVNEPEDLNVEENLSKPGLNGESNKQFKKINYDSYQQWEELFNNYKTNEVGRLVEIPKIRIAKFPKDMNEIARVAKKKQIFFNIMTIGAYHANQEILSNREKLKAIISNYQNNKSVSSNNKKWLEKKFELYGIKDNSDFAVKLQQLKQRLDIIPISLILAQSAVESGWGTSRFVIAANNIFGEWTFDPQKPGIVPQKRPANASYRIRKFPSIESAINSYLLNLNSHYAYKKLRKIRSKLRAEKKSLDSLQLAKGLIMYSEKREEYVQQLNNIIRYNDLKYFDSLLRK